MTAVNTNSKKANTKRATKTTSPKTAKTSAANEATLRAWKKTYENRKKLEKTSTR